MNLYIISLTTVLLVSSVHQTAAQTVGEVIGDLPAPILNNLLTIITSGTVNTVGNCSLTLNVSAVKFILYSNGSAPQEINSSTTFSPSKPIVFVIHGWSSSPAKASVQVVINAFLQQFVCYVIAVDWSAYAQYDYQTSYCYVPFVGKVVGEFICTNLSAIAAPADLLVASHSMGAHVAGFAGQTTQATCGTLGRIVGLDPAGPLYQDVSKTSRLDAGDATFVQIIHSNMHQFGYWGDLGSVDFYPNCGFFQPSCLTINANDLLNSALQLDVVWCSHSRACYYFAESVIYNDFPSKPCLLCGTDACQPNVLTGTPDVFMGEYCRSPQAYREYTLTTNLAPLYGRGPAGPKDSTP